MEESELILDDGLLLQRRPVAAGTAVRWPRGVPHRYDNPQPIERTVLCVDHPAFVPSDEIELAADTELRLVAGEVYY
jgi:dihydroneopterin aldolase